MCEPDTKAFNEPAEVFLTHGRNSSLTANQQAALKLQVRTRCGVYLIKGIRKRYNAFQTAKKKETLKT